MLYIYSYSGAYRPPHFLYMALRVIYVEGVTPFVHNGYTKLFPCEKSSKKKASKAFTDVANVARLCEQSESSVSVFSLSVGGRRLQGTQTAVGGIRQTLRAIQAADR